MFYKIRHYLENQINFLSFGRLISGAKSGTNFSLKACCNHVRK